MPTLMPWFFFSMRYGAISDSSSLMALFQPPAKLFICHMSAPSFPQMRCPSPELHTAAAGCERGYER